jgi:hypothetical protein
LRLERLAERVVLRQSQRGNEFTQTQGWRGRNGEVSRCSGPRVGAASILHDHLSPATDRGPKPRRVSATTPREKETNMMLATTKVEDLDRFLKIFSTKGA